MRIYEGNYKDVMSKTVFLREGKNYYPCIVTNFYFKEKKYALVPIEDIERYPTYEQASNRRVFYKSRIYVQ